MSKPTVSFEDLKLNRQILNAIDESGFSSPTKIQEKVIPLALAGHDLMGIAQTGTGKTAAFVLPILKKINYHQPNGPRALILAPTRELAIQISEHVEKLSTYLDIKFAAIYGGSGTKLQKESLDGGVDILVATPGRFMDFYREQLFPTKYIKTLVLDEADKMMDMGFMPQIRKILEIIPVKRQNLLFSATIPEKVRQLSEEFLEFPEIVEVSPETMTAETVSQSLYETPNLKSKIALLEYLLLQWMEEYDDLRVIVFARTKSSADDVFKFVNRKVTKESRVIHGNKDQNSRINAIKEFSSGKLKVLVATDVVARGIDIENVTHVLNFEVPVVYEDYVHRIGRTGRAKKEGASISFMNPAEAYHIDKIEKIISNKIPKVNWPKSIEVIPTEKRERIEMEREIDRQKKLENPDFKGAFHEKKRSFKKKPKPKKGPKRR